MKTTKCLFCDGEGFKHHQTNIGLEWGKCGRCGGTGRLNNCKTEGCNRFVEHPFTYCSIECACYDKKFNVKTGWRK